MNYFTLLPDGVKALILAYLPYPELKTFMGHPLFKAPDLVWTLHYQLTISKTIPPYGVIFGLEQIYKWIERAANDRNSYLNLYITACVKKFEILEENMRTKDLNILAEVSNMEIKPIYCKVRV